MHDNLSVDEWGNGAKLSVEGWGNTLTSLKIEEWENLYSTLTVEVRIPYLK